jgi:hypothetical protein
MIAFVAAATTDDVVIVILMDITVNYICCLFSTLYYIIKIKQYCYIA